MRTRHPPPHGFDRFIAIARDLHGERFQYDRSSWVDADHKVRIQCSAHGWFEQISRNHLRQGGFGGCYACRKNDGWERFVASARKRHGYRFEYEKDSWTSVAGLVSIKCSVHGLFKQLPFDHIKYDGCRRCGRTGVGLISTKEMVERFRMIHGNRYCYDKSEISGTKSLVTIVCKIHGEFKQKPEQHAAGHGCRKCSGRHRWTTEEFIGNSISVHGDKFTYARTMYAGALNRVVVTCKKHGDFVTQPSRHVLQKDGCPDCSPVRQSTLQDFLQKANARFGSRYDYSRVDYVNVITPVKIICSSHGVFEQQPMYHIQNSIGCPKCSYNVSNKETAWLDSLNLPPTTKRHARVKLAGRSRSVDAFDPATATVYEFWGSWWHGHPDFFNQDDVHPKTKKTYGQMFKDTQHKRALIKAAGYTLVEIWEHEYDQLALKGQVNLPSGRLSVKQRLASNPSPP